MTGTQDEFVIDIWVILAGVGALALALFSWNAVSGNPTWWVGAVGLGCLSLGLTRRHPEYDVPLFSVPLGEKSDK